MTRKMSFNIHVCNNALCADIAFSLHLNKMMFGNAHVTSILHYNCLACVRTWFNIPLFKYEVRLWSLEKATQIFTIGVMWNNNKKSISVYYARNVDECWLCLKIGLMSYFFIIKHASLTDLLLLILFLVLLLWFLFYYVMIIIINYTLLYHKSS